MNYKKDIRQMRWFVAMLMLVAAMVVPAGAWAQDDSADGYDSNGFASDGSYQPAIPMDADDIDGDGNKDIVYAISNAGQLYWFAQQVNSGNTGLHAVLTDNITVNTGVLDSNGNIASDVSGFRSWTPIGSNYNNRYTGTFNGNGNTISGLFFDNSSTYNVGLFGYISDGTIKNVGIVDSYFNGREYIGGLCGENQGTISDCYFFGSVNGETYVAGLCGEMYNGSLSSCYFVGTVSGNNYVGAVCGYNDRAPITNCFFNSDIYTGVAVGKNDRGTITNVVGKTTAQFNSGEVAYQLNGDRDVWGQTINTNDYPIFGGIKVYATTGCVSYSNDPNHTGTVAHDFTHSTDGKCSNCGNYEEPVKDENGVYQIDTFSKLYWFANQVNSGTRDIDAVLTANITVNSGVLKQDGTLADDTNGFIVWTPIGNSTFPYIGNFDGQQHTISGLYYNDNTADNVGLFGYIGGVMNNGYIPCGNIKNVSIADSYFCGKDYVGGICGKSETNPINNCSNSGTVNGQNFVGGVCGINKYGLVIECSNIGMVNGNDQVGGVCGGNYYDSGTINNWNIESGVIRNCSNTGKVSGHSIVGGVCGNNAATLDGCSNSGAINGIGQIIGGVCGQSSKSGSIGGEINNSHNTGIVTGKGNAIGGVCGNGINNVIRYCDNKGNVTGAYSFVGGICGLGSSVAIYFSYNTGAVSGIDYVGGIGGSGSISGYNSYNTGAISGNNYVGGLGGNSDYFYNCFSIGTVSGESNVGGINGGNIVQIINCYYDSEKFTGAASDGHSYYYINVCGKTTAQFKSGEVAYLLDALSDTYNSNDTGIDWGQTIGVEDFPVLGGQRVYATKGCATYSNVESATENEHSFGNGDVCTVCGSYRPATPDANGVYQIGSVNDLYWFAQQVNSGNTEISAVLTADITINEGVLKADGTLADDPSGLKQWQPIAYYGRKAASGTFDGNGHTISGLYVNDPSRSCVGLFANLSENATVKNLIIKDSYILGADNVGGVCGFSYGRIANCGFIGAVSGYDTVGGVCGYNHEAQISNSYFNGTVSGNVNVGGLYGLYDKASPITNCYYLASEDDKQGGKTAAQFKSGEVAWLLNGSTSEGTDDAPLAWYQNIDGDGTADEYPIPSSSHGTVYQCTKCTGTYSNTANKTAEHQYGEDNGICTKCGDEHQITITLPESLQHGAIKVYDEAKTDLTPAEGNTITVNGHPSLTFTAVADETEVAKYKVKSFKYGDTDVPSDGIIKVKEDITLTAEFTLDCFVVDGVKYQILADKTNEVAAKGKVGTATTLTIPESVPSPDDNELNFAVTQITDNAFENDSKITSVEIPASIASIGAKVFSGCSNITVIYCFATTPPSLGENCFPDSYVDNCKLFVPEASINTYKETWNGYFNTSNMRYINSEGKEEMRITITPPSNGRIEVYGEDDTKIEPDSENKIAIAKGTKVNIKALEDEDYAFSGFMINGVPCTQSTVEGYEVTTDINISASFRLIAVHIDDISYKIISDGVMVTKAVNSTGSSINIKESVEIDGVSYTVKSIGANAFAEAQGLKTLYVNSKSPLSIEAGSNPFADIASTATLRVPYGAIDAYKAENCPWNVFNEIRSFTMDGENNIVDCVTINVTTNDANLGGFTIEQANGSEVVTVENNAEVPSNAALSLKVTPKVDEANGKAYATLSVKNGDTALTKEEGEGEVYALTVGNEDVNIDIAFALKSFQDDNLKYEMIELEGDKVKVTGKVGSASALTFPESVTSPDNNELSYAVTQIADNAFANDAAITSVEIPASILSIGAKAFSGCSSLKEIIFTGTVPPTIGEGAFSGIHKDAIIIIPIASVDKYKEALGEALASKVIADKGVITLTHNQGGKINVYVVNGDTETLQTPADGNVLVDWGTQVKIEAVADEGYVFDWLKINNESLGIDVNTYTVRIMRYSPSTVSGQGENFGDITAEASFSVKIATSDGGGTESVLIKGSIDTTGGTQTIIVTHCDEGTESATIPEALGASGTTYIPVTSIAASAFEGCAALKSVEIPSSITTIGSYAFMGCTSLETFKIRKVTTAMPSTSATRAAARAAADDVTVPEVDEHAFDDIVDIATLYVPEGWKEAFKADPEWGKFSKIKEYRDDENEMVLAELTLTASTGGSLTVGAVTSTNDTQTVKVAEGSNVTVTVAPAEGYILSSLLYGGQDVMAQVFDGTLTLTALEGENTLTAVFSIGTGIGAAREVAKNVYVLDGRIIVDGAAAGEVVIICDAAGRMLRREVSAGEPIEIAMAAGKVYIVRIGKQSIKLTM